MATAEEQRSGNALSHSAMTGQDTTTMSSATLPTSPSRESMDSRTPAYRQHIRKESQARERAQRDALMDDYAPTTSTPPSATNANALPDHHHRHEAPAQDGTLSSHPGGFAKLLHKIGLKK